MTVHFHCVSSIAYIDSVYSWDWHSQSLFFRLISICFLFIFLLLAYSHTIKYFCSFAPLRYRTQTSHWALFPLSETKMRNSNEINCTIQFDRLFFHFLLFFLSSSLFDEFCACETFYLFCKVCAIVSLVRMQPRMLHDVCIIIIDWYAVWLIKVAQR